MDIKINGHEFNYDITSMAMLFFPGEKVNYVKYSTSPLRARSSLGLLNGKYISSSTLFYNKKYYTVKKTANADVDIKNLVKQTFYLACSKATGIVSPWGILTGIRPLSVYARHIWAGDNPEIILKKEYYVAENKISLLSQIYKAELPILESNRSDVSLYISIPFCPSKCSYCSFVSVAATNKYTLLSQYLENLFFEIRAKAKLIKEFNLNLKSIYIGGGTPGILNENQLVELFNLLSELFDLDKIEEICFELGRPETVSTQKLNILEKYNVSRVCINTQTTNDSILNSVNRKHSFKQYTDAILSVKNKPFRSINTDLIAGLPGENYNSFCKSVDDVIDLDIDNITIHTLAIKKSSNLSDDSNNYSPVNTEVTSMLEYAYDKLISAGYIPYYIYRQKNCVSNGENIGFCKPDKLCLYNIYMMEDVHSVIACGAGASTKFINGKKVDRIINVKYPMEYVREFDKIENNINKTHQKMKEMFQ